MTTCPKHHLAEVLGGAWGVARAACEAVGVLGDENAAALIGRDARRLLPRGDKTRPTVAVVGAEALISILVDDAPSLGVGHSTAVRQLCWHAAVAILGALRRVDHGVERYRFRVGDGGPVVVSLA
jgi:hypothetical protein